MTKENPFPGMNPWMQEVWSDMHTRMIGYIADVLSSELPDDLVARAEENMMEDVTERWIEIRTGKGKLITVIELTSPANKTKKGRTEFEEKFQEFLDGGVNFVEIDLIRGGHSARDYRTGTWPDTNYQVIVNRPQNRSVAEVYGFDLREPLPAIRIPLRANEPDAALDLQPLVNRCYKNGRYWMLPYEKATVPRLSDANEEWALQIISTPG